MKVQIKCSVKAQTRLDFVKNQNEFEYKERLQTIKLVTQELERRGEGTNSTGRTLGNLPDSMPPKNGGTASFTSSRPQYLWQFAKDNALIDREFDAENLGICKPTVKEKIKAEIFNAYAANDMARDRRAQDQVDKILEKERAKQILPDSDKK